MTQRDYRSEVLEAVDDGMVSQEYLLQALVLYLSNEDIKECLQANAIQLPNDIDEDE